MSIPALGKLLFARRPMTNNMCYSSPSHDSRSKTQLIASHRFYSTFKFESGKNIDKEIDVLGSILSKKGHGITSIAFPRRGFDEASFQRVLKILEKNGPWLPAIGTINAQGAFTKIRVFYKPEFDAFKELEDELNACGRLWGYQMQNILLDDESTPKLSCHFFRVYRRNDVVLTLDPRAKVLYPPRIDPLTLEPDLSNRTFTFFGAKAGMPEL